MPLDHGYSEGPVRGLTNLAYTFGQLAHTGINGVIIHKGTATAFQDLLTPVAPWPFLLHVSGSMALREPSEDSLRKVLLANALDAEELGATAISIHVNLGNRHEDAMVEDLVSTVREAHGRDLPVLVMMYVRSWNGAKVIERRDAKSIAAGALAMAEAGADIVKVSYPGDLDSCAEIVGGCFRPVLMAGGPPINNETVLDQLKLWIEAGGTGGCLGRIVFSNDDAKGFLEDAWKVLRNTPSKFSYPQFGDPSRRTYLGPDIDLREPGKLVEFSMRSTLGQWYPGATGFGTLS